MTDGAGPDKERVNWRSRSVWGNALLVLLLGLFVTCYRDGVPPLAGTEGHRAIPAHTMVQTGDWLLPRLYGKVYLTKPPMVYWLIGGVEKATGIANETTWRLPSALAGGLLGLVLCLVGNYWFGRTAGLVAGLSHVVFIALIEGYRSADIDALDIAASVITALAMIELLSDATRRRWMLAIGAGIGFGTVLLLKGPGGLPVVFGALLGAALFNTKPRDFFRALQRPDPWVSLLIGIALFGAYLLAAYMSLKRQNIPPDLSGLNEAARKSSMLISQFGQVIRMPFELAAYSMPLTIAIVFALRSEIWNGGDARRRWYLRALIGTLAMSLAICFLSGMSNPRYAYVIVPPLALVAGALADRAARGEVGAEIKLALWRGVWIWATLLLVATIAMGIASLRGADHADLARLIGGGVIALLGWWIIIRRMRQGAWPGRAGLALLCIALGINVAMLSNHRRVARSTYADAHTLAEHVKPTENIITGLTALDQPELFYYARVHATSYGNQLLAPIVLPDDGWVVLKGPEYAAWSSLEPSVLSKQTLIVPQHGTGGDQDAIWLAWYTRPVDGATTRKSD
jgi:4-amino-4-deoxy-L-arabinose transferase-like glycosyltransferase